MKKKIGLVLAGGGGLGSYELGAFLALYEEGIRFDIVTGTSIGALNGAFIAANNIQKMEDLWDEITPEKIMVDGINFRTSLKYNLQDPKALTKFIKTFIKNKSVDITPFKNLIKKHLDLDALKESNTILGIITTNVTHNEEVRIIVNELDKKMMLLYLHASSACVPYFPSEEINGEKYVDGFFKNNFPIHYAFLLGADEVYAVDLKLFNLESKNQFLTKLHNVKYIAPRVSLGSMIDFSQETIQKNKKRGYNDTKKLLGYYRGYIFTFLKNENFDKFATEFETMIFKENGEGIQRLRKFINEHNNEETCPLEYKYSLFLTCLEFVGLKYEMIDEEIYDVVSFYQKLYEIYINSRPSVKQFITRIKTNLLEEIANENSNLYIEGALDHIDNIFLYLGIALMRIS